MILLFSIEVGVSHTSCAGPKAVCGGEVYLIHTPGGAYLLTDTYISCLKPACNLQEMRDYMRITRLPVISGCNVAVMGV